MPIIQYEVDIDLSDLENDIKRHYCNCDNCLQDNCGILKYQLENYIKDMEMNLYHYSEKHRKFKSYEEIYEDLKRIIEEN